LNPLSLFKPKPYTKPTLLEEIDLAHKSWIEATGQLNFIDSDLLDYVIFKINAAERRFMALIKQAKEQKIAAWPAMPIEINRSVLPDQSSEG